MSWRRIAAIYRKDLRDALRDSRVVTALVMPLLLGLLYSFIFPNNAFTEKAKVGIASPSPTGLVQAIADQAPKSVKLTFVSVPDAAQLRRQVQKKKLDAGLVVPAGFDQQVRAGRAPTLVVVLPSSPTGSGGDFVAALLDRAVQSMAGRAPAAQIVRLTLPPLRGGSGAVLDALGARTVFILAVIVMLLIMVAVYAVPAVLVEETEKKTIEALALIASTADVIAAKALFGISMSVVSVPVLLAVTRAHPHNVAALVVAVVVSAVVLVGIGLLFGGLLRTQQQVNTWSGLVLVVLLAPGFTIGLPVPDIVNRVLGFLPTVYAYHLVANVFSKQALFANAWLSYLVLAIWAAAAYALVWWRLSRQEA